jgi:hypothetical protein
MNKHFPSILQGNTSTNANESSGDLNEDKLDQSSLSVSILPESEAELDVNINIHYLIKRLLNKIFISNIRI